ncbi:MAG: MFS transporter [Microlunatus sp.]|nr:MFS transporter [Microlunatus sp.]MDN5769823.1 MFS transporter [Microlunatus sp.]
MTPTPSSPAADPPTPTGGGTAIPPARTAPAKVIGATVLGTTIEWYDFAIFVFAAAVVFPTVFFPTLSPGTGVLSSFATLAIAAIARPLGALIFGHIGDSIGRRRALILSMVLMSSATVAIGLVPGFGSIGWFAPAILLTLRIVQSVAVGGEWGGAVAYAVESAPPRWRAVFGSFPQIGNSLGLFLASAIITLIARDSEWFIAFGWRIPFFVAGVFGVAGIILRLIIDESPEFVAARRLEEQTRSEVVKDRPLIELFRTESGLVLQAAGAFLATIGCIYISLTYVSAYAANNLNVEPRIISISTNLVSVATIIIVIVSAVAGDKFGVRRVTLIGLFLPMVIAFPMFWILTQGGFGGVFGAMMLGNLASSVAYATIGTMVAGWFPARVRQSGLSLAYQIAGVVGSFMLVFAQLLEVEFGGWVPAAILFFLLGLLSWLCALLYRDKDRLGEVLQNTPSGPEGSTATDDSIRKS